MKLSSYEHQKLKGLLKVLIASSVLLNIMHTLYYGKKKILQYVMCSQSVECKH